MTIGGPQGRDGGEGTVGAMPEIKELAEKTLS